MTRFLHALHRARVIEALAVAIAAAGAVAVLAGIEFDLLDALSPWADLIAGALALIGVVVHHIDKKDRK